MGDEERVVTLLAGTVESLLALVEELAVAAYAGPAEDVLRELATVETVRDARRVLARVNSAALAPEQECQAPEGFRFGRAQGPLSGIDHLIADDLVAGRAVCGVSVQIRQVSAIRLVMPKLCVECARLVGLKLGS